MKIFRIYMDGDRFQGFYAEDDDVWMTDVLTFDGTPKLATWSPPALYILEPKLERGNFFDLTGSALVVDSIAMRQVGEFFEMSGELLPFEYKGETFHIVNVTKCFDVLDQAKTEWSYGASGAKLHIEKFAFHANRIDEPPLFKIPETCKSSVLTFRGLKDPEDEFPFAVEKEGLKGLVFEELWSDES